MAHTFFTSESESILRDLQKEHEENFINTPGLNKTIDGILPLTRRQLKRTLHNPRTSYPQGKIIEHHLGAENTFQITVFGVGGPLPKQSAFLPQKVSFSGIMNNLFDAIYYFRDNCDAKHLYELKQLRLEFAKSDYSYEIGLQLEELISGR